MMPETQQVTEFSRTKGNDTRKCIWEPLSWTVSSVMSEACLIFLILHMDTQNFKCLLLRPSRRHYSICVTVHWDVEGLEPKKPRLEFYWDSPLFIQPTNTYQNILFSLGFHVPHSPGFSTSLLSYSSALLCWLIHILTNTIFRSQTLNPSLLHLMPHIGFTGQVFLFIYWHLYSGDFHFYISSSGIPLGVFLAITTPCWRSIIYWTNLK